MLDNIAIWLVENWDSITVALLLFFILIGGSRPEPWWVFGREFRDERYDKEEWKELALRGTGLADRATKIAEKRGRR